MAALPVTVEAVHLEAVGDAARTSTEVVVRGGGQEGRGEDVTHDADDRAGLAGLPLHLLCGTRTLAAAQPVLDALAAAGPDPRWPVVRNYRRWALESALIDLALMQAGLTLPAVLGGEPRPVRLVTSRRVDQAGPAVALLAAAPGMRLKLDARATWTPATVAALAATGAVDVIDLKGTAPGSSVHEPPDPARYRALATAFPHALFEDPDPDLAGLVPRVVWDEPVTRPDALDTLPTGVGVNVKPCRLGGLAAVLVLVADARSRGLVAYGGGMSERGVGRSQGRLLASLLYPDGPNDLAPDPPVAGPLRPVVTAGFRAAWPG